MSEKEKSAWDQLTLKEQLYVKAYIECNGNQYRAYVKTFGQGKKSRETIDAAASRLTRKVKVRAALEEEYKKIWAEKDSEIEKSKTYQAIHNFADFVIDDICDDRLGIKDLKEMPEIAKQAIVGVEHTKDGVKLKFVNKLQAIELRAKIQKMIDPKDEVHKLEITIVPPEKPVEITE
jgi:hypothetical protein